MTSAGEIWLGDLAWSLRLLGSGDPDTRAAIARALGFQLPAALGGPGEGGPSNDDLSLGPAGLGTNEGASEAESPPPPADTSADIAVTLPPLAIREPPSRTEWRQVAPLEPFSRKHATTDLPFEPLFDRRKAPALIAALSGIPLGFGPFDVPTMVAVAARGTAPARASATAPLVVEPGRPAAT